LGEEVGFGEIFFVGKMFLGRIIFWVGNFDAK
jgi:hypothetical protein